MKLDRLREPFPEEDIQWRIGRCGIKNQKAWAMLLAYVDARAVRARLNEVFGIMGWQTKYYTDANGVICELSVKIGDEWITKADGANYTDFESYKGGVSDAFKRACVNFGIGEYLYNLEETYVEGSFDKRRGWIYGKADGKALWFPVPKLPVWALPGGEGVPLDKKPVGRAETPLKAKKASPALPGKGGQESAELPPLSDFQWLLQWVAVKWHDNGEAFDKYLMKIDWVSYGETWRDLKEDKIKRIRENPDIVCGEVNKG